MSTLEIALVGITVLAAGIIFLALINEIPRLWSALVGLTCCAYFQAPLFIDIKMFNIKKLVILAMVLGWAVLHTFWIWQAGSMKTFCPPIQQLPGHLFRIFLMSAPVLIVQAEIGQVNLGLWEFFAILVWAAGTCIVLWGRFDSQNGLLFMGEGLIAWSFYIFALSCTGGYLTIFSPIILVHQMKTYWPPITFTSQVSQTTALQ